MDGIKTKNIHALDQIHKISMNNEIILVVDDSREMADYLADQILASLGYRALKAYSGRMALDIIRNNPQEINLILLDLEMPDMSGLDLLRKVSDNRYNIPAIMITAHGSEQIAVDAFRLGVHDYLNKPVNVEGLDQAITQALSETRLRQQKAALTARLQEQIAWFSAISDIGQSGISSLSIDTVLGRIVEAGVSLTQAEQGFIALLDSKNEQLYLRAVKNISEEKVETARLPISDSLIHRAFQTGRPVRRICETQNQSLKVSTGLLVHSLIHVPIHYHGRPLGVLSVNNHTRLENFSESDETLLSFLADYSAIAIVNAKSIVNIRREIEERRKIESELRESEERYTLAVRGSNDGLWDWDLTTNQIYFSPRWKKILGYLENEIQSSAKEWFNRVHPDDLETLKLEISSHLHNQTTHFTNEHRLRHKNGSDRWVLCRGTAVWKKDLNANLSAVRLAGSISDITDRKTAEERLLHDALHDTLTGLPNRVLFMDRLNQAIERSRRQQDYQFAVLFLDIDNFKDINNSIGHFIGDKSLVKIAEILKSGLRTIDTVARFGGDEFLLLLDNISDRSGVDRVVDWILKQFQQDIKIEDHIIQISASIGVVLDNSAYKNAEEIIRNADIAMNAAKANGKARTEIFQPAMRLQFLERLNLEIELRKALENNEFVIHYQPVVYLENRALVGFEALVRWQHPQRGLLNPGDFIILAEDTGLIFDMSYWILSEACRQITDWNRRYSRNGSLTISINISGKHITDPGLYNYIVRVLKATRLDPTNLKLEITELSIVDGSEFTVRALSKFHDMGVQLQIDDFGIGYSSLSYLSRFPINALKIDKSFVSRMGEEKTQKNIIRTIIALTEQLNVGLIAEGIETQDQLEELVGLGCNMGQGFLISQPLDSSEVDSVLARIPKDELGNLFWKND